MMLEEHTKHILSSCCYTGVMGDSVQSAKRTILNKFRTDSGKALCLINIKAFRSKFLTFIISFESLLGGESLWHADRQYTQQKPKEHYRFRSRRWWGKP